ncbi:hypothetical protein DFH09DRAFT_583199 [Mycena vulgaris]|nr:hypothetical protein DFH09DRAFT_583199 [Mycena vulgaris]
MTQGRANRRGVLPWCFMVAALVGGTGATAPKEKAVAYPEEVLRHTDVRLPQRCGGGAEDENVEHSVDDANALMSSVPWTRIYAGMAALDDSGWAKARTQGTGREEHAMTVKQEGDAGSGRGTWGAERRAAGRRVDGR